MIVYELPLTHSFPENVNTPRNIEFYAVLLGTNNGKGLWSIEPITQEDLSVPNVFDTFGVYPINLTGDVTRLGYKRTFMPGMSIVLVEQTINQTKEMLSIGS